MKRPDEMIHSNHVLHTSRSSALAAFLSSLSPNSHRPSPPSVPLTAYSNPPSLTPLWLLSTVVSLQASSTRDGHKLSEPCL